MNGSLVSSQTVRFIPDKGAGAVSKRLLDELEQTRNRALPERAAVSVMDRLVVGRAASLPVQVQKSTDGQASSSTVFDPEAQTRRELAEVSSPHGRTATLPRTIFASERPRERPLAEPAAAGGAAKRFVQKSPGGDFARGHQFQERMAAMGEKKEPQRQVRPGEESAKRALSGKTTPREQIGPAQAGQRQASEALVKAKQEGAKPTDGRPWAWVPSTAAVQTAKPVSALTERPGQNSAGRSGLSAGNAFQDAASAAHAAEDDMNHAIQEAIASIQQLTEANNRNWSALSDEVRRSAARAKYGSDFN